MTLSPRNTAIQLSQTSSVPHLGIEEVNDLAAAAGEAARNVIAKERDPLLIMTLFDGALRVSEGLLDAQRLAQQWIRLDGPGGRPG